jgi:hypothetical protein
MATDTIDAASSVLNVIAVRWGRDQRTSIVLAANRLAAAGASDVGIVLWAVPDTEVNRVER